MRKLRQWGVAATLALVLAVHPVAGHDEDEEKPPTRSWWGRLFGKHEKPAEGTEKDRGKPSPKKISDEESAKAEQEREASNREKLLRAREDYLRREKVLDRLMQLAQDRNDQEMLTKVKALNDRAWSVYLSRTGQKPTSEMARVEERSDLASSATRRGRRSPPAVNENKEGEQP